MKKVIKFIKENKKKVITAVVAVVALAGIKLNPELVDGLLNLIIGVSQ